MVVERLRGTLALDEQARAARFRFERDRHHFIVGRGTLRALLGRYLGAEPGRLEFRYEVYGRPALAVGTDLRFNLAHSHGLALVAVARDREVGVDIEQVRPIESFERIIERFFSPRECATFRRCPRTRSSRRSSAAGRARSLI